VALVGGEVIHNRVKYRWLIIMVLFLDELPEFKRDVLEVMRQPLKIEVTISRAKFTVTYPSSFMLVASMNRVRVVFLTIQIPQTSPHEMQRYLSKIRGFIGSNILTSK
jgi:magnesium chelatase family protein